MLGRLIKHEFKATWRVPVALDAVLIALGILAHFMIRTIPYVKDSIGFIILMLLFVGIYYIGIIAANIVTLIFIVMRYYRNLYTSEGYLTFTLPVTTNSIINAKVISGFTWTLLSVISTGISIIITLTGFLGIADIEYGELYELASDFLSIFDAGPSLIFSVIFLGIVSSLYNVLSLYFSVTVGQLWEKHKILGAVLCYIGIYILNVIIGQAGMFLSGFYMAMESDLDNAFASLYTGMLNRTALISALLSIVFYTACIMITKRKINLD